MRASVVFHLETKVLESGGRVEKLIDQVIFYIYIYAFSRRFYPKRLTLHSSYSFYIESALEVAWSPVLSFHSLWWFGVQCHLLVLVHCVFWKPTSLHPFTKKFWSTSCFLLLTSFLKMLISFSSRNIFKKMFKKPVWDYLSFVTWCIILLEVAIRRWVHCSHKGMDMVSNNIQVGCGV